MKHSTLIFPAIAAFVIAAILSISQSFAQNAYIANTGSNDVSVIDTVTNSITKTIAVGSAPNGVAVTKDGSKVYIANGGDTVSVIAVATNTVTTIPLPPPAMFPAAIILRAWW
jgi:YVTN family beta-propeller protein